jgi:hypothetical protein
MTNWKPNELKAQMKDAFIFDKDQMILNEYITIEVIGNRIPLIVNAFSIRPKDGYFELIVRVYHPYLCVGEDNYNYSKVFIAPNHIISISGSTNFIPNDSNNILHTD